MAQEYGDFTSGEIRNVPDWVARNWLGYGLVEQADSIPALLQSKPEVPKYEVKPQLLNQEVKKRGRNRKHI